MHIKSKQFDQNKLDIEKMKRKSKRVSQQKMYEESRKTHSDNFFKDEK